VGPLMVVRQKPLLADGTDLFDRRKEVGVEDLLPIGPVEAFDVGIPVRLARLNVVDADTTRGTPLDKDVRHKLRPVVDADRVWTAMERHQFSQDARHTGGGQRRANLQCQGLAIAFVDQCHHPKPAAVIQRVAHEIERLTCRVSSDQSLLENGPSLRGPGFSDHF
jgi:hypothetical protein